MARFAVNIQEWHHSCTQQVPGQTGTELTKYSASGKIPIKKHRLPEPGAASFQPTERKRGHSRKGLSRYTQNLIINQELFSFSPSKKPFPQRWSWEKGLKIPLPQGVTCG
ncbi:MAG TPA: hypothetical protein VK857_00170, partial [Desulforhopalus sp.]|nr:hypothetical protein [Desulforhopalus sp.]